MNERIRELAKQLGYNVNFEPSTDETDREYQVVSNDFAEKFAELIVKETLQVARAGIEFGDGMEDAVYKYFGVEK